MTEGGRSRSWHLTKTHRAIQPGHHSISSVGVTSTGDGCGDSHTANLIRVLA